MQDGHGSERVVVRHASEEQPSHEVPNMVVSVSRRMPVDAGVAWDLFVDTARWPEWGPSVTRVDVTDGRLRAGSTGRVRTALGPWVPFEITEFDEGRRWSWSVAGVPATTHTVEPTADGCRVSFGVAAVAAPYLVVCRAALRRIEELALAESAGR